MSRSEREAALARLLLGGMIGAVAGAVLGLVVFGGILFLPPCTMAIGAAVGAWVGGEHSDEGAPAGRSPAARSTLRSAGSQGFARDRSSSSPGTVRPPSARSGASAIDVNTAGVDELSCLPGVGRAAAARILAHRERYGRFASLREIEAVDGFDAARVRRMAPGAILSSPEGEPGQGVPAGA